MDIPILTIVVPCYNEEAVFRETAKQLSEVVSKLIVTKQIADQSGILFVDDGSKDATWSLIQTQNTQNKFIKGLKLAHNVGHQNALLAGLEVANKYSDCIISIDADLQDDVSVITTFLEKYWQGYDVVFGVREKRDTDTFFKRSTALGYYSLMNKIGIHLIPNHADFRLMSKRAVTELLKYKEANIFLRGIVPMIGFPSTIVKYDRKERYAGESKYPLKKMIAFAFDGLTSFSVVPIRFVSLMGILSVLVSLGLGTYALYREIAGLTISGWSSLFIAICFFGGLQLLGIGMIGEYIGKIYHETKQRPKYAIEEELNSPVLLESHRQFESAHL